MEINPSALGAASQKATGSQSSGNLSAVDFDNFLRLLTAQLRHQDPLSPLDSTEFVAQLANFSSVEQLVGANRRLDEIAAQLAGGPVGSLANWLDRRVGAPGVYAVAGDDGLAFRAPAGAAAPAQAIVRDQSGQIVDTLAFANTDGLQLWSPPDGSASSEAYTVEISYTGAGGEPVTEPALVYSRVVEARREATGTILVLEGGATIEADAAVSIRS